MARDRFRSLTVRNTWCTPPVPGTAGAVGGQPQPTGVSLPIARYHKGAAELSREAAGLGPTPSGAFPRPRAAGDLLLGSPADEARHVPLPPPQRVARAPPVRGGRGSPGRGGGSLESRESAMSARVILHADMDAFYASVEQRDRRVERVHVGVEDDARAHRRLSGFKTSAAAPRRTAPTTDGRSPRHPLRRRERNVPSLIGRRS